MTERLLRTYLSNAAAPVYSLDKSDCINSAPRESDDELVGTAR